MNFNFNNKYKIILASQSPRRSSLLKELGLCFTVDTKNVSEDFPNELAVNEIAAFLAEKKAMPFFDEIETNTLVITADTIVHTETEVLGKPLDHEEATRMLEKLSGRWHTVSTGVCILSKTKKVVFTAHTQVLFKQLTESEINYYVTNFQPFDKAGAYGIQEWIGLVAVQRIEGSYFNVMGLPVQRLYEELIAF